MRSRRNTRTAFSSFTSRIAAFLFGAVRCRAFGQSQDWPSAALYCPLTWGISAIFSVRYQYEPALQLNRSPYMLPRLNGADIPYGCRQCQCGTCATRLLEGEVECPDGVNPDGSSRPRAGLCDARVGRCEVGRVMVRGIFPVLDRSVQL